MKKKPPTPEMVSATMSEADGVRYLHLDSIWIQGAMRIAKPNFPELEYIQRMLAWMLWREPAVVTSGRCVQLGLGAGALTRFSHRVLKMNTTVVELNPTVIQANRLWFRLGEDDARLKVLEMDAAAWVAAPEQLHSVQVLNVDLYDHDAAAPVLDSAEFYAHCRSTLDDEGGLMTVNLFGRSSSFGRSAARIVGAFGLEHVWSLRPTKEGNTVIVAGRGVALPPREELVLRAAAVEEHFGLPARKWLRMIRPLAPETLVFD